MIEVELRGTAELRRAAADLRAADKLLDRRIDRNVRGIGARFATDVRDGVPHYMPSGYSPTLAGAVKVATSIRRVGRGAGVKLRIWAAGKTDERDVRALNDGRLRHPLWGRRTHWYVTTVRPRFVDDPRDRLAERAHDELLAAVDEAAAVVTKG